MKRSRINEEIKADKVRLISHENKQLGIVSHAQAMEEALKVNLQLVEVDPNGKPPVCKLLDYNKTAYKKKKQVHHNKKTKTKEIKFRPGIDKGDLDVKIKKIISLLTQGDRIKVTVRFRGREIMHVHLGMELLNRLRESLEGYAQVDQEPKLDGKQITMLLVPIPNKKSNVSESE